jgi:hypothetical protein
MSHQPHLPENRSEADQWRGKAVNGMFSFYSNMAQGIAPIAAAGICSFTRGYQTVVWAVFLISIRSAIAFFRGYSLLPMHDNRDRLTSRPNHRNNFCEHTSRTERRLRCHQSVTRGKPVAGHRCSSADI